MRFGSIPRQACLGLIEASSSVFGGFIGLACIPRQACLGLIEAETLEFFLFRNTIVFRGKLASASLKHGKCEFYCVADNCIPRQACLGLIEARRESDAWNLILRSIPRQACLGLIEATRIWENRDQY